MPAVAEPESAVRRGCGLVRSSHAREADIEGRRTSALATFNLENLFARPKVFNLVTWSTAPIHKATGSIGPPRHVVPS